MDIADFLRSAEWSGFHWFRRTVESDLADSRKNSIKMRLSAAFFLIPILSLSSWFLSIEQRRQKLHCDFLFLFSAVGDFFDCLNKNTATTAVFLFCYT